MLQGQGAFYEESALPARRMHEENKFKTFRALGAVLLIAFGFAVILSFFFVNYIVGSTFSSGEKAGFLAAWFAAVVAIGGFGFFFWFYKNRCNVSYDYVFVEDELRVTRVSGNGKRRLMARIAAERVLELGWAESEAFARAKEEFAGRMEILTPNKTRGEEKEFYYIVYLSEFEKELVVIEAHSRLFEYLVRVAGGSKLQRK